MKAITQIVLMQLCILSFTCGNTMQNSNMLSGHYKSQDSIYLGYIEVLKGDSVITFSDTLNRELRRGRIVNKDDKLLVFDVDVDILESINDTLVFNINKNKDLTISCEKYFSLFLGSNEKSKFICRNKPQLIFKKVKSE